MISSNATNIKTRLGNLESRIGSNTLISGSSIITEDNSDTECFIPFVNNAPSGTAQPLKGNNSLTYNALTKSLSVSGSIGINTTSPVLNLDVAGGLVGNSTGDLTLNVHSVGVGGALKIAGGSGLLTNMASGNSGQHLKITINGTVYKIKLEDD